MTLQMTSQQDKTVQQLNAVYHVLQSIADVKEHTVQETIDAYFLSPEVPLFGVQLSQDELFSDHMLSLDIRAFLKGAEGSVTTGRQVARIFHGIESPCYKRENWGKNRLWRSRLQVDFDRLVKLANQEIVRSRSEGS